MTTQLTVTFKNGRLHGLTVLGKMYKGDVYAKTFANLTQATTAAEKVGGSVSCGFPFYVIVNSAS